jgi:hypothetical protein
MADYTSVLGDHVTLKYRSLDRIFLQGYVPKLQCVGQVCTFLHDVRGYRIPSSAAFGQIGRAYEKRIRKFAKENHIPLVRFAKRQNKEKLARRYFKKAARQGQGQVVLIGIAQEKASVWRSWKAKGHEKSAHPHMEWKRHMSYINHYYFYIWDEEWGPTFWKTNAYAPFSLWLWLNGHEWAKRQVEKAGLAYEALDNGFATCEDEAALQRICARLGPSAVHSFFWRWFFRLPSPFTADDLKAGYVYELAFRQLEVAQTWVFERPQQGRLFFEGLIRDHLDVGRPENVALFFNRRINRCTKGSFRTRVLNRGATPVLTCHYKSARLKQYLKQGRALRTETVLSDSRDFRIGRRVCAENWYALQEVGETANQRLCDAQLADARPLADVPTWEQVSRPTTTGDGLYAPSIRFGDPRVMAVLASLVSFCHLPGGFTNRDLVDQVAPRLEVPYTSRQSTYDLRRLKRKGLIVKVPRSRRYQLAPLGRRVAVLFVKTYGRLLTCGLAELDLNLPEHLSQRSPLARAWRVLDRTLEEFLEQGLLAA